MTQFTVCRNKNPQTRSAVPFLLDVQNDLFYNRGNTGCGAPLSGLRNEGADSPLNR
jgi:hypothetical protein